jgi:hypothetical protein
MLRQRDNLLRLHSVLHARPKVLQWELLFLNLHVLRQRGLFR